MICKFIHTIEKYKMLETGDTVIVALSGGADSMTLLHLCKQIEEEYSLNIIAAHVNHMIRGDEANRDMDFVTEVCTEMNIELRTLVFDVPGEAKTTHESLEECGRRVRYDFFKSISQTAKIATAHNLCDNEETVLMNMVRGSGLNGLKGISPVRGNIIRPLLFVTRQEIEDYCLKNNISYVHDSTNDVDDYKRNYVRHNVLPQIKQMNKSFDKAFANCVSLLADDCDYFEKQTQQLLKKACIGENKYDVQILNDSHRAVASRALTKIISSLTGTSPEKKHVDLLMETMLLKYGKVQITGGTIAFVRKGVLYFENETHQTQEVSFEVNFESEYLFFDKKITFLKETKKVYNQFSINDIDCDKLCGKVYLRNRRAGDEISLQKRKLTKSLKKLFSQENIVQSQRCKIPVIADESGIVWVYGFGCDERCKVDETTKNIINVKCKSEGEK